MGWAVESYFTNILCIKIRTERMLMDLFKKILKISGKIILGIFLFYLLLTLVLIPLICPKIIKSQIIKRIKHEVNVRSVSFNPFLWKLKIKDFAILDSNNQLMVGFDKFWADISFVDLLKKKYHCKSIGLSGLKVNAVLLSDGNINLLEMIHGEIGKSREAGDISKIEKLQALPSSEEPKDKAINKELPFLLVDLISMDNGKINFVDKSLEPNFITGLSDINLKIINLSTDPKSEAKISFKAKLDDNGIITNEAIIKPFAKPLSFEMVLKLNDYILKVLTPYVGKFTGRTAQSGKLNLTMEYRIFDNKLDAKHKILVQGFDFGDKVESEDALKLPFGMALALLEDTSNRIKISLPVDGDMTDPKFHYFKLIGQVARNFFFKLITKPFSALVSLAGSEDSSQEYGYINFQAGTSKLSIIEQNKIKTILKALNERPSFTFKLKQCYDPLVDWYSIKEAIFEDDFKLLSEESERSDNWVYERLYERRFGMKAFWNITKKYFLGNGEYDFEKINQEVKSQLISVGAPDKKALEGLAASRAQMAYDFIIIQGFDAKRVSIGGIEEVQASDGLVPLELELKVFNDQLAESEDSLLPDQVK